MNIEPNLYSMRSISVVGGDLVRCLHQDVKYILAFWQLVLQVLMRPKSVMRVLVDRFFLLAGMCYLCLFFCKTECLLILYFHFINMRASDPHVVYPSYRK